MLSVSTVAVGAVGVPVNAGDANGATCASIVSRFSFNFVPQESDDAPTVGLVKPKLVVVVSAIYYPSSVQFVFVPSTFVHVEDVSL